MSRAPAGRAPGAGNRAGRSRGAAGGPGDVAWVVVATFSSVTRQHVLQAIAEHDQRGSAEFLALYGFEPSLGYHLVHEGREYDSTAIVGVAHRYATGRLATPAEFHDGVRGAAGLLSKRGFEVLAPASAPPVVRPSAARTRTPRVRRATHALRPGDGRP